MSRFALRPAVARRRPALALGLLALTASALAGTATAPPAEARPGAAAASVRPLLTVDGDSRRVDGLRQGVAGVHQLVDLDTAALPRVAKGQRLSLPLDAGSAVVRIGQVERDPAFTAWSGRVEGQDLGSFTIVEADGVYRGSLVSPDGLWSLAQTAGGRYRWTELGHREGLSGDDAAGVAGAGADGRRAGKSKKVKIGVMFGFTVGAKAEAGSKAALKAAAALVISQTNEALTNSGLKVKVKYRGLVKAKGTESADVVKDAFRVGRPRDGHFDNLQKVRRKHGGDIIHLLTTGSTTGLCGGGLVPYRPSSASPFAGASVTRVGCLPYLVATHEIGHNLGADHFDYRAVSPVSKVRYARAFANPAGNYISVMGYYDPCVDAGVSTCVRIPWFSSPTNTFNGQPLASGKNQNNTLVIKKTAPRVARYVR